jgi:hypothetical protein
MAMLLAAALAAASVGSAATAKTSKSTALPGHKLVKGSWGGSKHGTAATKGKNGHLNNVAFQPVGLGAIPKSATQKQFQDLGKLMGRSSRPTRGAHPTSKFSTGTSAVNIPHVHSLPVTTNHYDATAQGITEGWVEATHGFGVTPPDQALAEGHGQVLEAVNLDLVVMDTNFNHSLAIEPIEALFAPGILATGFDFLTDPRAIYDNATGRWFITVSASSSTLAIPGSAVFIAVSTTSDAQGTYAIYVLDTSFDGTTCGLDGCIGDQPNLGFDRYTLTISTNSFDFDTGAFNGAQLYVIDKTALAGQFLFPSLWYYDIGGGFSYPGFVGNTCGSVNPGLSFGVCLASVQPGNTPNQAFVADHGGTLFMLESLDPFGSTDNRIVDWALTGTAGVVFSPPELSGVVVTTQAYGYPATNNCMVMPQMIYFGLNVNQCGLGEQPADGTTFTCDFYLFLVFGVTGGCEPGEIATNDDRMEQVTSVKANNAPATVWGGLNTDMLVSDPLGNLHRRAGVAWFSLSATAWCGNIDICGAAVNGQGYIGNWQNDELFPSIAVIGDGVSAAIVYSVTGNNNYPSVAVSKLRIHQQVGSIPVAVQGDDVLDDLCTDLPLCGFPSATPETLYRPRFGDYSAAVSDGVNIWVASEYASDNNRGFFSNWATGLVRLHQTIN